MNPLTYRATVRLAVIVYVAIACAAVYLYL